jgi:hypothetical protein
MKTLHSFISLLDTDQDKYFILSDDSDEKGHEQIKKHPGFGLWDEVVWSGHHNYSHNIQQGVDAARKHNDVFIVDENDFVLTERLDIDPHILKLTSDESVGMIRLGWMTVGIDGTFEDRWWRLHKESNQYVYSHQCRLYHVRFIDVYEPFNPGEEPDAGAGELYSCTQFNQNEGPDILFPAEINPGFNRGHFKHIGFPR